MNMKHKVFRHFYFLIPYVSDSSYYHENIIESFQMGQRKTDGNVSCTSLLGNSSNVTDDMLVTVSP